MVRLKMRSPAMVRALGTLVVLVVVGLCSVSSSRVVSSVEAAATPLTPISGGVSAPPTTAAEYVAFPPSFLLQSSVTAAAQPFTLGHAFRRGDLFSQQKTLTSNTPGVTFQLVPKVYWRDGSVKHAIVSGFADLTKDVALNVTTVLSTVTQSTPLAFSDLVALAPSVAVSTDKYGSVNLNSLLAKAPKRTFISGPMMSEFHFNSSLSGGDAHLQVYFYCRLYCHPTTGTKQLEVETSIENNWMRLPNPGQRNYNVTLTMGGTQRYKAAILHYFQARWSTGGGYFMSPSLVEVVPMLDMVYLRASKVIPNFAAGSAPTEVQKYAGRSVRPFTNGDHPASMGGTGYTANIGLFPHWEALFVTTPDPILWNATLANAYALASYPLHYRDENTGLPFKYSSYPKDLWLDSVPANLKPTGTNPFRAEWAHQPGSGYFAYLVSGRYYLFEEQLFWATWNYYSYTPSPGYGRNYGDGLMQNQVRGQAWVLRTYGGVLALWPDEERRGPQSIYPDFVRVFGNNWRWRHKRYVTGETDNGAYQNVIGCVGLYSAGSSCDAYGCGDGVWSDAPWMQHFFGQAMGFIWDAESIYNQTDPAGGWMELRSFRNHAYKHAVGITGLLSTGYPYQRSSAYILTYGVGEANPPVWYKSWAEVYNATKATNKWDDSTLHESDPLLGDSGGDPGSASGYYANMFPALALAVDHGAPGATQSYARLTMARNAGFLQDFSRFPQWGVFPRRSVNTDGTGGPVQDDEATGGPAVPTPTPPPADPTGPTGGGGNTPNNGARSSTGANGGSNNNGGGDSQQPAEQIQAVEVKAVFDMTLDAATTAWQQKAAGAVCTAVQIPLRRCVPVKVEVGSVVLTTRILPPQTSDSTGQTVTVDTAVSSLKTQLADASSPLRQSSEFAQVEPARGLTSTQVTQCADGSFATECPTSGGSVGAINAATTTVAGATNVLLVIVLAVIVTMVAGGL